MVDWMELKLSLVKIAAFSVGIMVTITALVLIKRLASKAIQAKKVNNKDNSDDRY